ncbi:ArsI/CadI family heavy metal resistance metalloenzyme [Gammaproteobacteria bacterium AB-CW1]|uniref:ArsI/CadI family heavy metal resistance metalloenzyme n=1 Tax=Natronospira elongata TaxID=3110268 RepID=A0AAP6JGA2_9GAMM|nr:ArsI/CadI family heavy metal resistance metalloenzyme [Gammaproteobacteria bacterium AB-CW1]
MKRLHVHVGVSDLEKSIRYYTALFGSGPTKEESGYAKWMLEEPRVNFAISSRCGEPGVSHLGIQVDSQEELAELRARAETANADGLIDEGQTTCCYAQSEKHWSVDPQGVAWEHFLTIGDAEQYGDHGPVELIGEAAGAEQVRTRRAGCGCGCG